MFIKPTCIYMYVPFVYVINARNGMIITLARDLGEIGTLAEHYHDYRQCIVDLYIVT